MLSKIISQANIDHVEKWFERAEKIVIVSHVSPDGDAIGSSLGLYHFLDALGKRVNVIMPNSFPVFFKWMPGANDIIIYNKYANFVIENSISLKNLKEINDKYKFYESTKKFNEEHNIVPKTIVKAK